MPEMFGPYEVVEQVAVGSTGRVYRARHIELGRIAAIKELAPAVRSLPGQADRLRAEAALLATLSHPNIVALYDYVEEPDRAWLAEQWVDGASLEAILSAHGALTPVQALGVVRGAVAGLAYAHDQGVVHRDVSAANVLADMSGTSMLVDFGLAAPAGAGPAVGTPAFLSPEAARGDAVGKPGDVYSAAAVLYLLLAGRQVFVGSSAAEVVRCHVEERAPRLTGQGAGLEDLLARSLSKDPGERPPDAAAFLVELETAARRRFGADWLERASIAGLVGFTVAGGLAGVGAGNAAGAETMVVDTAVVDTAVVDTATRHAAPTVAKVARKAGTKFALVAGGAVVALGLVAAGMVATNAADDDHKSGPSSNSSTSGAPVEGSPSAESDPTAPHSVTTDPAVLDGLELKPGSACQVLTKDDSAGVLGRPVDGVLKTGLDDSYFCGHYAKPFVRRGDWGYLEWPRGVFAHVAKRATAPAAFVERFTDQFPKCRPLPADAFGSSGVGFYCSQEPVHGYAYDMQGFAAEYGQTTIFCALEMPETEIGGRLAQLESVCLQLITSMPEA